MKKDSTPNTAKYKSYKLAFSQIKLAKEKGFSIEAIALEESIISDRLQSAAEGKGFSLDSGRNGRTADFSKLVKLVESKPEFKSLREYFGSLGLSVDLLKAWGLSRNDFIHNVVHGFPGKAPAIVASEFSEMGKKVATTGLKFARAVCNWSKKDLSSVQQTR